MMRFKNLFFTLLLFCTTALAAMQCHICTEQIEDGGVVLDCNHIFHAACIREWCLTNPSCTYENCRRPISEAQVRQMDQIIAQLNAQPTPAHPHPAQPPAPAPPAPQSTPFYLTTQGKCTIIAVVALCYYFKDEIRKLVFGEQETQSKRFEL